MLIFHSIEMQSRLIFCVQGEKDTFFVNASKVQALSQQILQSCDNASEVNAAVVKAR